ncbi:hypothetical protein TSAR_008394 [Trichomalopsis sarcophagae]|uniref:Uncharacterized protein n=1 Tax=Trichomalopsis sarcophagae TaxID=543379 RepID=A0A232F9G1_9HYME|nr:hypothetical protein TSAR_008394 [Trichomalopsis sarcophagae]
MPVLATAIVFNYKEKPRGKPIKHIPGYRTTRYPIDARCRCRLTSVLEIGSLVDGYDQQWKYPGQSDHGTSEQREEPGLVLEVVGKDVPWCPELIGRPLVLEDARSRAVAQTTARRHLQSSVVSAAAATVLLVLTIDRSGIGCWADDVSCCRSCDEH